LLWEAPETLPAVRALAIVSPEPLLQERTVLLLHRLTAESIWREEPVRLLRSRDGTRALVVPVTATMPWSLVSLPAGDYRLELRYRLTGVTGLPNLTRQNEATDEVGTWAFQVGDAPARLVDAEA
jgi:hypothetical protein